MVHYCLAHRHGSSSARPRALSAQPQTQYVHMWRPEIRGRLEWMYSPIFSTMRAAISPLQACWRLRTGHCSANDYAGITGDLPVVFAPLLKEIRSGDVFVWVGARIDSLPLSNISARGALIVHYQTEHYRSKHAFWSCESDADEVWTFSWRNMQSCQGKHNKTTWRYVPPGAMNASSWSRVNMSRAAVSAPVMLGKVEKFTHRANCMYWLNQHLTARNMSRIAVVDDVFSPSDFRALLAKRSLFLQLARDQKWCGTAHWQSQTGIAAFRVATLVDHGALVVSHRTNPSDQEAFDVTISFTEASGLAQEVLRLQSMNEEERTALAQARTRAFRERFRPEEIFQRAGVYDRLQSHASETAHCASEMSRRPLQDCFHCNRYLAAHR